MIKGKAGAIAVFVVFSLTSTGWVHQSEAASVKLRYGFKPGAVYRVTEQDHTVSKTVTEMDVMGQLQRFESPSDQVSSGTWSARAVGKVKDGVKLQVEYGQRKGGERWSAGKVDAGSIFGKSSAEVIIHPVKGVMEIKSLPAGDQIIDIIYQGRFAWMPKLPEKEIKVGGGFTHEYVLNSGMYHVKSTDEYYLVEVKSGFAIFDVETKTVAVIRMSQAPTPEGMPSGVAMNMGDMKMAYKGSGTAVFDMKEGIFVEREGKMSYSNMDTTEGSSPLPGGMSFSSRMEGVTKYQFEMERE